jgi:DNA replication and repair protein RecF
MRLTELRLRNFRNHRDSSFEFDDGTNVILGDNGQGKTNVIEGIAYLGFTKSFYATHDSCAVQIGQQLFEVNGVFVKDSQREYAVRLAYSQEKKEKLYSVNKGVVEQLTSVIGQFPIVICSPEHAPITTEGPSERRKFIDLILSQSNATYLQNLIDYRKVLRQRNAILLEGMKFKQSVDQQLEPWTEQLLRHGSYLMLKRKQFLDVFGGFIRDAYNHIAGDAEEPTLEYEPAVDVSGILSDRDIYDLLRKKADERRDDEIRMGTTLVGPHRDELKMMINDLDLRRYASQGQHKTYLVAVKIGEFKYLLERCGEPPVLLLDDIFSELDDVRSARLLSYVGTLSQTFITTTRPLAFHGAAPDPQSVTTFYIKNGVVEKETALTR